MTERGSETPDQARTRRRWISLAEFVAVAGLLIGVVSLYFNWSDRRSAEVDKQAEQVATAKTASRVTLSGTPEAKGERLALSDPNRRVASVTVAFPAPLGVARQETVTPPAIEASWIAAPLLVATDGGPDRVRGHTPVLITSFWAEDSDTDTPRADTAIYDLSWHTDPGTFPFGRTLKVDGLLLRRRGGTQAQLDRLWKAP